MSQTAFPLHVSVVLPDWVLQVVEPGQLLHGDEARMRVAIRLARENVIQGTGGPFGAAIFEAGSGRLAGVGVNLVVPLNNSCLHAEVVAFMTAQAARQSYTLAAPGLPDHELFTSCEPCAMCLGASLWSGVKRVVWAATRDDADKLAFDEGPVFASSYKYLRRRGLSFTPEVLRAEAQQVFRLYSERGGEIYNA
jgi:tRNA(Arg) A34 adenosine deaminase TadA